MMSMFRVLRLPFLIFPSYLILYPSFPCCRGEAAGSRWAHPREDEWIDIARAYEEHKLTNLEHAMFARLP